MFDNLCKGSGDGFYYAKEIKCQWCGKWVKLTAKRRVRQHNT
jgi:hypothetical protein